MNDTGLLNAVKKCYNIDTNAKLSKLTGVSEKTIIGWKKKPSPAGRIILNLLLEIHRLKEVEKEHVTLKNILNDKCNDV